MTTPANALQTAVYATLTGNATLTALVTGVYDHVPQGQAAPYVVIGDDTSTDWSTKTVNGWEVTLTIHCWDFAVAGRKSVKAILSAIYDALHRQDVSISGFNLIDLPSEFEQTFQETGIEGQNDSYYHGVARYRALIHA